MMVCPMPAPCRVMPLLLIETALVHVHDPAGTITVSPSTAELIADWTLADEQLAAVIVFPAAAARGLFPKRHVIARTPKMAYRSSTAISSASFLLVHFLKTGCARVFSWELRRLARPGSSQDGRAPRNCTSSSVEMPRNSMECGYFPFTTTRRNAMSSV